jgi:hypothetical protein
VAGAGGFNCKWIFGTGAAPLSGSQRFAGLTSTGTILAGDPSTDRANIVGMGKDAADTNWHMMHRLASGTTVKVDLLIAVAANQVFEMHIYSPPNGSSITIEIFEVTGFGVLTLRHSSVLSNAADIPAQATFLQQQIAIRNGAASAIDTIEMGLMYFRAPWY